MLWELFYVFLMIGAVSFGGGYAMIPLIEHEVTSRGWMTTQALTDVIAVAGMSPGPIATNSAIFVGYQVNGIFGAMVSALGMIIPSLLIVIIVASFFYKIEQNKLVQSAFYGLRPIITGLIVYAAIRFALSNDVIGELNWHTISMMAITAGALFAMLKFRTHPLLVIIISGLVGVALYV